MRYGETFLRELSEYSARHGGAVPFSETVVRFHPGGDVCLMNRQTRGWGERAESFGNLLELARAFRLTFVEFGEDKHGRFVRVVPRRV